mmetsp:Transcript_102449/g.330525  ORF Transcript_102449/g.330525 Transcript_102449/m.330525 type:complete len:230 (-) Transcript_102449:8-697(-)
MPRACLLTCSWPPCSWRSSGSCACSAAAAAWLLLGGAARRRCRCRPPRVGGPSAPAGGRQLLERQASVAGPGARPWATPTGSSSAPSARPAACSAPRRVPTVTGRASGSSVSGHRVLRRAPWKRGLASSRSFGSNAAAAPAVRSSAWHRVAPQRPAACTQVSASRCTSIPRHGDSHVAVPQVALRVASSLAATLPDLKPRRSDAAMAQLRVGGLGSYVDQRTGGMTHDL